VNGGKRGTVMEMIENKIFDEIQIGDQASLTRALG
jgi:hypothetical protein